MIFKRKNKISLNNLSGKYFEIQNIKYCSFCEIQSQICALADSVYKVYMELEYGTLIVLLDKRNFTKLESYTNNRKIPFKKFITL